MSRQTALRMVSKVRIYCDGDAFLRDEFGRRQYCNVKPIHDDLFQAAIDRKLATDLVVLDSKRFHTSFRSRFAVLVDRPHWWPAMRGPKNKSDLLVAKLTAFNRSWFEVRRGAEPDPTAPEFWQDDPALATEVAPQQFVCRTASVGHEGIVYYFVYEKEREWESSIRQYSLTLFGEGESAYRRLVPEPGLLGGP